MTSLLFIYGCATQVQFCDPNLEATIRDAIEEYKAKEEERDLWEDIMGLCPREGRKVVLSDPTGELIRTLKGHENWVWCLSITPDGRILADGSLDRTVRLWSSH